MKKITKIFLLSPPAHGFQQIWIKVKNQNTYKILINELTLDAFIGIHDFEKKKKQKIAISLSLDVADNISRQSIKLKMSHMSI